MQTGWMKALRAPEIEMRSARGWTVRTFRWRALEPDPAARPLLFFTGFGAAAELLAPFLERIRGRDVITFDMPGIGRSPGPERGYRPRTAARFADRLLSDMGYGEVDVMGVSWGGMIAQQFAFTCRGRTGRLVLAATSPGAVMVPGHPEAIAPLMSAKRHHDPEFMWRHFETIYGGKRPPREALPARLPGPTSRGYAYQMLALAGWTSLARLPFISAPTLILMGGDDRLVPPVNGRLLKLLLRRAELRVIDGAGHLFLLTHAHEMARDLAAFLDAPRAGEMRLAAA